MLQGRKRLAQLPLHSTENHLNVVWNCDQALFMSIVSCLSLLARYTMHDTRHLTYDTNRNVSESVQSVGSNLAFRHFEVLQHLKRTHIICVCCVKSVWLLLLLRQKVKDKVPQACISWCCKDTCNFGTVTGSRFADFSQSLIKTVPLHGTLNVTDTLCILLGSKFINTRVCDTPEALR
jgi:hypothetical protein